MQLHINGQPHSYPNISSAEDLIVQLGLVDRRIALELNQQIVPRTAYAETRLQDGDHIEIVHAIGGG